MSEQEHAVANAEPMTSEAFRKALNEATRVDICGGHTILYHGHWPAGTTMSNDMAYSGLQPGAYIARFNVDGVEFHPVKVEPEPYKPSNAFPTPESLREFVEQRVSAYLDEKLDERVGKALDELAQEMNNKALQPTSRVE